MIRRNAYKYNFIHPLNCLYPLKDAVWLVCAVVFYAFGFLIFICRSKRVRKVKINIKFSFTTGGINFSSDIDFRSTFPVFKINFVVIWQMVELLHPKGFHFVCCIFCSRDKLGQLLNISAWYHVRRTGIRVFNNYKAKLTTIYINIFLFLLKFHLPSHE